MIFLSSCKISGKMFFPITKTYEGHSPLHLVYAILSFFSSVQGWNLIFFLTQTENTLYHTCYPTWGTQIACVIPLVTQIAATQMF